MRKLIKNAGTAVITVLCSFLLVSVAIGQNNGAVKLEYKSTPKPLSYTSNSDILQSMDFGGMSMQVGVKIILGTTITGKGKAGENLSLNVRIDTMAQSVDSPNGSMGGAIDAVKGKSFNMVLSPSGKVVDASEAAKITYTVENSGETNLGSSFEGYFVKLPEKAIKPGDTWSSVDSSTTKAAGGITSRITQASHKFEGYQTVDGVECARVTAVLKGTMQQTAQNMGMDILTKGEFTGTGEYLFSIGGGYLVKETTTLKLNGNIEISGPQSMTAPLVMDMTTVQKLK
ncbi:MAG: hypothetical protein U0X39_09345 [Bacteroidales bacterium]